MRNGHAKGQQLWRCRECGHQFFANGRLPRIRKPDAVLAAALLLYFDCLSLSQTGRALRSILGVGAHPSTVHDWVSKYVPMVDEFLCNFPPTLSGIWHMDET